MASQWPWDKIQGFLHDLHDLATDSFSISTQSSLYPAHCTPSMLTCSFLPDHAKCFFFFSGVRAFACDVNSVWTAPPSDHHRADFLSFMSQLIGHLFRKAFHDTLASGIHSTPQGLYFIMLVYLLLPKVIGFLFFFMFVFLPMPSRSM